MKKRITLALGIVIIGSVPLTQQVTAADSGGKVAIEKMDREIESLDSKLLNKTTEKVMLKNCKRYAESLEQELHELRHTEKSPEFIWSKYYYSEFLIKKANIQVEAFEWQSRASERMLWIVTLVVLAGVVFSAMQLFKALSIRLPERMGSSLGSTSLSADEKVLPSYGLESSLEVSIQQIRVTSSVVGVAVLAISLVFYYFFLKEVYHIRVVDTEAQEVRGQ